MLKRCLDAREGLAGKFRRPTHQIKNQDLTPVFYASFFPS